MVHGGKLKKRRKERNKGKGRSEGKVVRTKKREEHANVNRVSCVRRVCDQGKGKGGGSPINMR